MYLILTSQGFYGHWRKQTLRLLPPMSNNFIENVLYSHGLFAGSVFQYQVHGHLHGLHGPYREALLTGDLCRNLL